MASSRRLRHFFAPMRRKRGVAELLVVGLVPPEGMMGQLQVRREPPVEEQCRADAGPERDDELEPGAAHDVETLKVGVIDDPHGSPEARRQASGEVEASPCRQQLVHDRFAPDAR